MNHLWAYDFVFDTCANNQALKCLTIVDEWTRECLAIDVAGGIRSERVIEVRTVKRWVSMAVRQCLERIAFATRSVHIWPMRGAPARAIQELAGHQDLSTTQR